MSFCRRHPSRAAVDPGSELSPPPANMSIRLYAEFLLNIRQVTIYAQLQNEPDRGLQAHVVSDRKTLVVTYDGESKRIVFPSGIRGKATLGFPVDIQQVLSLRLEFAEDESAGPSHGEGMQVVNDQPWSALSLSTETEIACRACRAVLVGPGAVTDWRDLPREHWADMMDLWHCHKPPTETNGTHPTRDGRYGALGTAALSSGTGFVDTTRFLVPEATCGGSTVCDMLLLAL